MRPSAPAPAPPREPDSAAYPRASEARAIATTAVHSASRVNIPANAPRSIGRVGPGRRSRTSSRRPDSRAVPQPGGDDREQHAPHHGAEVPDPGRGCVEHECEQQGQQGVDAGEQGRAPGDVAGGREVVQADDTASRSGDSPGDEQRQQQRRQDDRPGSDVDLGTLGQQPQPAGQRDRAADAQPAGRVQGGDDADGERQAGEADDRDGHRCRDAEPDQGEVTPLAAGSPATGQTCQQRDHVTTVANARRIVRARAEGDRDDSAAGSPGLPAAL